MVARGAVVPETRDAAAGQQLAQKLQALAPSEPAAFRGVFELERPRQDDRLVPVTTQVELTNDGWIVTYRAQVASGDETLTILHHAGRPSTYTHSVPGRNPISVVGDRATNSFAGSDFALLDLGLEFFHWPIQVVVTREMKKGRGCQVLESRPANTNLYSRVVSWIDEETSGLLMAEAYDANGRQLKQFEVRHFKKVAGQWQVEEMELRNRQTRGSTRLRFEFDSR